MLSNQDELDNIACTERTFVDICIRDEPSIEVPQSMLVLRLVSIWMRFDALSWLESRPMVCPFAKTLVVYVLPKA